MPQMGESIAEGTMSRWLKKVGDAVKRDEPIFEISTDKVDAEIPSPTSGVLAEVLVTEGQTVPVQTIVARIETEAGAVAAAPAAAAPAPAASAAAPAATGVGASGGPPPKSESTTKPPAVSHPSTAATPTAPQTAARSPGGNGDSIEDRLRTKSSPLVRKIAAEHGIEIAGLQGSGIAGRVTKRDIMQVIESGGAEAAPRVAPSMHAPAGVEHHGPMPEPWAGDVVESMSRIRALTAEHMSLSRRTNAHVTSFFEVDLTRVARIRAKLRADFEKQSGEKLTYLPFILTAVTAALKQFPILNAAVAGNSIIYRKQYNLGIAVALDWGLIVPVIKNAEDLSLSGLTKALNDLADRARNKKLKPEEVQEATFTITNPGVFGSLMGTPIIPMGTSAILGLGAIEKRPKVITGPDGEDTIAIRTCAYFSLSFDHRIVDGSDADKFLAYVKKQLESYPEAGA
jgi:pyruvate dehydrogenase E2 component (dihydrolipoamide acetyltransferase)